MAAKFEMKKTKRGQYMFNLKAGNGQIIPTSAQYRQKASAINGIESVKQNAGEANRFERKGKASIKAR